MKNRIALFTILFAGWIGKSLAFDYYTDTAAVRAILDASGITQYGVETVSKVSDGRITELHFGGIGWYVGLTSLPSEVGNLTKLKILVLENNEIASLPPEIGNLAQLEALVLDYNQLTSLPPEIGNLSKLKSLTLQSNKIASLPPEIGNLSQLTRLNLDINQLSSLPSEIGNLSNLKSLIGARNQLTSLPPEIGNLSELVYLNLYTNKLTSLPPELGNLSQLKGLDLGCNELGTVPPLVFSLLQLEILNLMGNGLTSLPSQVGNLTHLKDLTLTANPLTHIPREIGNLTHLEDLYLNNSQLLKDLPLELGRLQSIRRLLLGANLLTFLPDSITLLKPEFLSVSHNRLCNVNSKVRAWLEQYATDWGEMQFCDEPFFTSPRQVSVVAGEHFEYKVTYFNPIDSSAVIEYSEHNPGWVNTMADTIFGTPTEPGTTTIRAFLSVAGTVYDALSLILAIEDPTAISTPFAPGSPVRMTLLTPNCSPDQVNLHFMLDKPGAVALSVLDLSGRVLWCRNKENAAAGYHRATWYSEFRAKIPNGIYLVSLKQGNRQVSRRFTLVR